MPEITSTTPPKRRLNLSLDPRVIIGLLLLVIVAMLLMWRPWDTSNDTSDRTVDVVGQTKIKAEPDEFVFYPAYDFSNNDREVALKEATEKSDDITAKLKELGVADSKIKTDTSSFEKGYFPTDATNTVYTLRLTVTVAGKEAAQKIQDYLVTTTPTGSVSPQGTFSEAKKKELENEAREAATKDARGKADQMAKNLGFKVGNVKAVSDSGGFGDVFPVMSRMEATDSSAMTRQLAVQPGENELSYSVTVTYYLR